MNILESIKNYVVQGHIDANSKIPKDTFCQPGVKVSGKFFTRSNKKALILIKAF